MRLLNAATLKLRDFPNESRFPPYVILSHTWDEKEEVTLQDMSSLYPPDKKGYSKIINTCRLARERGIEWVWIDTCCIDKTNSSELAESINYMFRWYKFAQVCVVYLADFTKTPLPETSTYAPGDLSRGLLTPQDSEKMAKCRWFHRGWTLQELLAPAHVEFYDTTWTHIGSKERLCPLVSHITLIPQNAILGTVDLDVYSTAQRMSWASSRVTTKIEDAAYSLLGLFDVNMPLIYGEKHRAFQRLQEEIMKTSSDFTLFGWTPCETESEKQRLPGDNANGAMPFMPLMASSPRQFKNCYNLEQFRNGESEFSITNRGLRLTDYFVLKPLDSKAIEPPQNSACGWPSPELPMNRVAMGPRHTPSRSGSSRSASGVGFGLNDHGLLSSPPASSTEVVGQHRYRYVLTIGKRRTIRPEEKDRNKINVEIDEIGICLRKTGPGQLARDAYRPLEKTSRVELRNKLNTTEVHTFYITLWPNRLGSMAVQPPQSTGPRVAPGDRSLAPVDSRHNPSDWRNGSTTGTRIPPPPVSPVASSVLKYSDLSPQHPLRIFYHTRLLRGIYIPSLTDRSIVYNNFPQQPFDEHLRIFCLPESASEVISFPCRSRKGKDDLLFCVLVDFRHGHNHPQCKVVDRSSVQSQFFFALSMRSPTEPTRWYMVEKELPDVALSTNRLRMKSAHNRCTYEIVATADNGPVPIDNYTLLMPTLDITITKVTG